MSNLIIFPAIDIMDGKVVRLKQGKFDQSTDYSDDPVVMAKKWKMAGAQWVHVVDLDGARTGEMKNIEIIKRIAKEVGVPVQVGGGIRSIEKARELLAEEGIKRIVLGTKSIGDEGLLDELVSKWQDRVAVSVDCAEGFVTQRGWVEKTDVKGTDLAAKLEGRGITCIIYTDIHRDGMMQGPNLARIEEILKTVKISVIASGGVSNEGDIQHLCALKEKYAHLTGVITGKAIYEKALGFQSAVYIAGNYKKFKDISS